MSIFVVFCPFCHLSRGEKLKIKCYINTYIQTDRHTEPPTKWVLEEHSLLKIVFKILSAYCLKLKWKKLHVKVVKAILLPQMFKNNKISIFFHCNLICTNNLIETDYFNIHCLEQSSWFNCKPSSQVIIYKNNIASNSIITYRIKIKNNKSISFFLNKKKYNYNILRTCYAPILNESWDAPPIGRTFSLDLKRIEMTWPILLGANFTNGRT